MRDDWLENCENEYVYDTNAVLDSIDSQPTVDAVEESRAAGAAECRNANREAVHAGHASDGIASDRMGI